MHDAAQATAKRRRHEEAARSPQPPPAPAPANDAHLVEHELVVVRLQSLVQLSAAAAAAGERARHRQVAQREQRQQGLRRCRLRAHQGRPRGDRRTHNLYYINNYFLTIASIIDFFIFFFF